MMSLLRGARVSAAFTMTAGGPRLSGFGPDSANLVFRFEHDEVFALVALTPEEKDDPHLVVRYSAAEDAVFEGCRESGDRAAFTARWITPLVIVDVSCELEPDACVLRKTVRCTARAAPVYIGGVRHWGLHAAQHPVVWPPHDEPLHQPVVLMGPSHGLLATLEWSWTRYAREADSFSLEFRPGYLLQPDETRIVAEGSLVLFEHDAGRRDALTAARAAFFAHLAGRIQPRAPCPIKFTTWGPWMGQVSDRRIREIIPDLKDIGADLLHIDAGWQDPHFPYSQKLLRVRGAEDAAWDRVIPLRERFPEGLQPLRRLAETCGLRLSLWFDTCCDVYLREEETWAVMAADGRAVWDATWEGRWRRVPKQSLASEYGAVFREFVLDTIRRYDLHGIVLDNHRYGVDCATGRQSMANGWNAECVQHRVVLEILDAAGRERPGLYRFFCESWSMPWILRHATHLHASDPSITKDFACAIATDHPLRCLAYERRLAWRRHYERFVPPWGIKGDIAGWSVQQHSAIPVNPAHADSVPGSGEGWTQNLFACLATTIVRDVRFAFRQVPAFDRAILKEWLAWDRRHAAFPMAARPLTSPQTDPDRGIDIISQVTNGRGILYLFNQSFAPVNAEVRLDEDAGFRPQDRHVSALLVYPVRAPLGTGRVSYGQTLSVPLIPKDCAVIEMGLGPAGPVSTFVDYERSANTVTRSFDPLFRVPVADLVDAVRHGTVAVETGRIPTDRHMAAMILAALGAASGRRLDFDVCASIPARTASCRLIVGTHDGLKEHPEVGARFRETLYSRYLDWDGRLLSAPLAAPFGVSPCPTFALLAPRPEQLARLGICLTAGFIREGRAVSVASTGKDPLARVEFVAVIPEARPALRFRPALRRMFNSCPVPEDLDLVRLLVRAHDGARTVELWEEEFPPFLGPAWWDDRLISLGDLAGKSVRLILAAAHRDGRTTPMLAVGYDRAAVMECVLP